MVKRPARLTTKSRLVSQLEEILGHKLPEGFYMSEPNMADWIAHLKAEARGDIVEEEVKEETDDEIRDRLKKLYSAFDELIGMTIAGDIRALIVSGDPGLGKSFNIERGLREYDPSGNRYSLIKGSSTAVALYKLLWDHRHEGSILVLDDCDKIFQDEVALNLLKVATDTSDIRIISYMSEGTLVSDKDQSRVPNSFEFEGTIVFISNLELDRIALSSSTFAPHIGALMSRGQYIDIHMRSRRDSMLRIEQVIEDGMLSDTTPAAKKEIIEYMREKRDAFRELSLRTALKISDLHKKSKNWQNLSQYTNFRNR